MHPDLAGLLTLRDIDERNAQLSAEVAALPKHIAAIEKKLESHTRKLEADRAALEGNKKERKRLEGDIQVFEQKISKLRGQMLEAKTNEQYRAFQNEIGYCETEIRKTEDRILALMEESEPLEKNVKAAETALGAEKVQVEKEKSVARTRTEEDKKAMAELAERRAALVAEMTPATYQLYERTRKARGSALAEIVDGRCAACHLTLRPQYVQDLKRGDKIMSCESCGRLMIYNPPLALDEVTGEPRAISS